MSLERISKARGRYIIQAWSSCPGLIVTRSQVGHMLQLNSPSPYPSVVLTNLSVLLERETDTVYKSVLVLLCIYRIYLPHTARPLTKRDKEAHKLSWCGKETSVTNYKRSASIQTAWFPFTIIQDRLWCDKILTTSVLPKISPLCTYKTGSDLGYQSFKAGQQSQVSFTDVPVGGF